MTAFVPVAAPLPATPPQASTGAAAAVGTPASASRPPFPQLLEGLIEPLRDPGVKGQPKAGEKKAGEKKNEKKDEGDVANSAVRTVDSAPLASQPKAAAWAAAWMSVPPAAPFSTADPAEASAFAPPHTSVLSASTGKTLWQPVTNAAPVAAAADASTPAPEDRPGASVAGPEPPSPTAAQALKTASVPLGIPVSHAVPVAEPADTGLPRLSLPQWSSARTESVPAPQSGPWQTAATGSPAAGSPIAHAEERLPVPPAVPLQPVSEASPSPATPASVSPGAVAALAETVPRAYAQVVSDDTPGDETEPATEADRPAVSHAPARVDEPAVPVNLAFTAKLTPLAPPSDSPLSGRAPGAAASPAASASTGESGAASPGATSRTADLQGPAPKPEEKADAQRAVAQPAPMPLPAENNHSGAGALLETPSVPAKPAPVPEGAGAAPPQPAVPPAPAAPAAAAREIHLQVSGGDQRVDVRLTERGGEVQVAVRTPDSRLAGALREDLPGLAARLEQTGFRTEAWHPAASAPESRGAAVEAKPAHPSAGGQDAGRQGGRQPQQDSRRRQPAPPGQPDAPPEEFSWLLSSQH